MNYNELFIAAYMANICNSGNMNDQNYYFKKLHINSGLFPPNIWL